MIARSRSVAGGLAERLSLAAAPTFAIMALLTILFGSDRPSMLCSAGAWPLGSMVPMYLLMSAFHFAPWLKLISRRWIAAVSIEAPSRFTPARPGPDRT